MTLHTNRAGISEPSLMLRSLAATVSMACARVKGDLELREKDRRALQRAEEALGQELDEVAYVRSAGHSGSQPIPTSRFDLARLLLSVRDSADAATDAERDEDSETFTARIKDELQQMRTSSSPEEIGRLAETLGKLFDAATDRAAAIDHRIGERVLTGL